MVLRFTIASGVKSPLLHASYLERSANVEFLISKVVDINVEDKRGQIKKVNLITEQSKFLA